MDNKAIPPPAGSAVYAEKLVSYGVFSTRTSEAKDLLHTLETVPRDKYMPPYALALLHVGLDERAAALECLERAFDAHDVHLVLLVIDPKMECVPRGSAHSRRH